MIILGIDPGASGGIAVMDGERVSAYRMPETYPDISDFFTELAGRYGSANIVCYLEDVGQGMPGQSSKATATFARHNGHLEMTLYDHGIRTVKVKPQKWQKHYSNTIGKSSGTDKREWKNRLKQEAQALFPSLKVTLWNADALLIANYARAQEL